MVDLPRAGCTAAMSRGREVCRDLSTGTTRLALVGPVTLNLLVKHEWFATMLN